MAGAAAVNALPDAARFWRLREIETACCDAYGVTGGELHSKSRVRHISLCRAAVCWWADREGYTIWHIGRYLGINHTSALSARRTYIDRARKYRDGAVEQIVEMASHDLAEAS